MKTLKNRLSIFLFLFIPALLLAQEEERPQLGSSDQVDNTMALDELVTHEIFELSVLNPYFDFKSGLKEKHGFAFGLDYSSLYFGTNSKLGQKNAGSGMVRLYGSWDLVGRKSGNTGALVFKVEHRHAYGVIPVSGLGFDQGYVGMYNPAFNDNGFRTTNLYWRQRLGDGRFSFVVGFLDVTDFFDVYAMASPWMHFNNFNFSTGVVRDGDWSCPAPNTSTKPGFHSSGLHTQRVAVRSCKRPSVQDWVISPIRVPTCWVLV